MNIPSRLPWPRAALSANAAFAKKFNTGLAPWKVEDLTHAVRLEKSTVEGYHDIGPSFVVDGAEWNRPGPALDPVVVRESVIKGNPTGVARPGWRLEPSPLPEQERKLFQGGTVRTWPDRNPPSPAWQNLLAGTGTVRVAPRQQVEILWDFQTYLCGYPRLGVRGGRGACVTIEWAEALYEHPEANQGPFKGHRDEVEGKVFRGFGDRFCCSGGDLVFPAFWWRSGRFVRLRVETADEPVEITTLAVLTTRYPLEWNGHFSSADPALDHIARLAAQTMRQGAHELMVDSPYYEQMAYVGDNLTCALVTYVLTDDTRLVRRALELFDWSRSQTGLVAERWPTACYQGSATYAMLWPSMVRNHAWWRDEPDVIRERLRGVRHLIEELLVYVREDGLLGRLPGWSFVDWVPEWFGGYPPGHAEGDSSIIQMHWLMSLQAAADLEEHFGEPELRRRWIRLADAARTSLITRYRNPENGLFYDDSAGHLSEHANALATLLGLRPPGENTWPETLEASGPVFRCTVYFSHYLFEAYRLMRRTDLFTARLDLWKGFLNSGLCTIPEQPEPSRSDCHAWGSHPLFHFHASFAGIRPASPGFRTVKVEPLPGKLPALAGSLPHPRGKISYDFRFSAEGISGTLHLPDGLTGELEYGGRRLVLTGGENVLG